MTLQIHRSERADALVHGLGRLLASVPPDPFTPEVVAVPTQGVERWITQTLAGSLGTPDGDGVCANVVFPSPGRLVAEAMSAATGVDLRDDPWSERRLTWVLLEVVVRCAGEPWCATLGRHLGLLPGGSDRGRRFATAAKLAGLFDGYAAQRPAMVRAWARGEDTDGSGALLEPDLRWQAELWRRVRQEIAAAGGGPSPAERLGEACDRLRSGVVRPDLPERLSVFGPTRLTSEHLLVLDALSERRDVHLWLPHPSDVLWRRVAGAPTTSSGAVPPRGDDATADLPRHPVLRSCARDARELQVRLRVLTTVTGDDHVPLPPTFAVGVPGTLLRRLQDDLREDRPPSPGSSADGSLQVHACHGRQRQVEVLREVLLGVLEDDPTLELRDVVVMCPDIEAYAPLISAAFGGWTEDEQGGAAGADQRGDRGEPHPGHRLRVRLADRSLRQTNPVLAVIARLLELADARLTVPEVLDLVAMTPVRARFGLDDDALELVGEWVRESGIRWGLDAAARAPFHLQGVPQNTWRTGLDRVLVGAAVDEDGLRTVGLALPLDDVESGDVDLAGRFAELVDRVGAATAALTREQPLAGWVEVLLGAVDDLTRVGPGEEWQVTEARRQLTESLQAAGARGDRVRLGLADVRALLAERLRGRPTRAGFRTGHLTMCTMVPMRSVPHRVVCLLGLDDQVFPRQTRLDGDDVLARAPRVGERDPRAEDRQLFLDAVLAAGERLVVLYTGADERTGAERPPAVPVGELLDVMSEMTATAAGELVQRHPLQPFDARNFAIDGGTGRAFSFDRAGHDGAQALRGPRRVPTRFLDRPLEPATGDEVGLDDLVSFLEHPARGFLHQRLGLTAVDEGDQVDDAIPVVLDGLDQYQVGDRMLRAALAGAGRDAVVLAERLRGELPPGALGTAVLAPVAARVETLVTRTVGLRSGQTDALDVTVDLDLSSPAGPGGTVRLGGTVPGVHGDRVVRVEYSSLSAKHRLRAWVQVLALAAARPGRDWCAATVGRDRDDPVMSALTAPEPERARALLAALVRLHREGRTRPLPLSPRTSAEYAERRAGGTPARAAVARAEGQWRRARADGTEFGEHDDAWHRRAWGDVPLSRLLEEPARAGDAFDEEPHRFGQLARQVFDPLLAHEGRH